MKIINIFYLICIIILCSDLSVYSQMKDKVEQVDTLKANEIKLLLKVSGTAGFAYVIIEDVMTDFKKIILNVPEGYWDKLKHQIDISSFTSKIVSVYDKRFNIEEIKDLISFFQSNVGKKWAISMKDMNDEVMIQADLFGKYVYETLNKQLDKDGYLKSEK